MFCLGWLWSSSHFSYQPCSYRNLLGFANNLNVVSFPLSLSKWTSKSMEKTSVTGKISPSSQKVHPNIAIGGCCLVCLFHSFVSHQWAKLILIINISEVWWYFGTSLEGLLKVLHATRCHCIGWIKAFLIFRSKYWRQYLFVGILYVCVLSDFAS